MTTTRNIERDFTVSGVRTPYNKFVRDVLQKDDFYRSVLALRTRWIDAGGQPLYDRRRTYDDNYNSGPVVEGLEFPTLPVQEPSYTLFDRPVNSRFGIPAGPLLNSKFISVCARLGASTLTYKTVRPSPLSVNGFPNLVIIDPASIKTADGRFHPRNADNGLPLQVVALDDAAPFERSRVSGTNSFGVPSKTIPVWQTDIRLAQGDLARGQELVVCVMGAQEEFVSPEALGASYADAARAAVAAGARIIEANFSCPNTREKGGSLYTDPIAAMIVSRTIKEAIGDIPLIIKLGYFSDNQNLATVIASIAPYINGLAAINTLSMDVVRKDGQDALAPGANGQRRRRSGVCGYAIRDAGLEMVARLDSLRREHGYKFHLIGVGGVMTIRDFYLYLSVGADEVQSAYAAGIYDPYLSTLALRAEQLIASVHS